MYTQCPHCQTCFRVAEAHLKAAKGKVRCGSCKEIFDATEYLYDGVPGADTTTRIRPDDNPSATPTPTPITPEDSATQASIVATPQDSGPAPRFNEILPGGPEIPEHDYQHIDLSTPPDRTNAPDQSPFMESLIGESSHYNKLDDMESIKIPGEADFTESFIKFVEKDEPEKPESEPSHVVEEPGPEQEPKPINPYEDSDAFESPATTQERAGIEDLYSAADHQLYDIDSAEQSPEQLNKDIEALLDGALAFDDDKPLEQPQRPKPEQNDRGDLADKLQNLDFNIHADIPLQLEDEPQLVPKGDEIEPVEVVSSEDIWSRKDSQELNQQLDDILEEDNPPQQTDDIDIGLDDFPAADNRETPSEPEFDIDEFLEGSDDDDFLSEPAIDSPEITASEFATEDKLETASDSIDAEASEFEDELPSMDHEIPKALRSSFESFTPHMRPIGVTMAMVAAIIVLVIAMLVQTILFSSYQLANQIPSLSPLLVSLCEAMPCRYSGSIDISKIEVLNRDMRSHPTQKNALLVSTAFVNKAAFDQPYPIIAIKLFDLSGNTVATRYFTPEEYLENLYSKFLLMESGTPVHITLAVLDPGDDAVNFEFSFL